MTVDFRRTRRMYRAYLGALRDQSAVAFQPALASEVETRLEQLDFLLSRIHQLDLEHIEYIGRPNPELPSDGKHW